MKSTERDGKREVKIDCERYNETGGRQGRKKERKRLKIKIICSEYVNVKKYSFKSYVFYKFKFKICLFSK